MRVETVTGQGGNGNKHAGVAGWSVPGYTELKALGSGGSGDVVLARHDASGTLVAVKYLRRKLLADPQWAGLFRTEAQVLAILDDPNIVRLYEYVESPSGAAIVMELVDGVPVREILTHQGGTTPEAALVVLQGSLLGLAAAHQRGIVHRDYKPENVLVNEHGDSKLTDFGIAARTGQEPVAAGSLLYAPPEQFAGTPASPAGDVYAATATFYECLTGRPPFTGETAERLLYQHLTEAVPLDPVPEPLRPLVAAGMAKEPENRPADATTLVTALQAVAARAYGPDWAERGRSHLGEAALLLAALWPSGGPAAVQGSAVEQVHLFHGSQQSRESEHLWHLRHVRHLQHLRHLRNGRNRRGVLRLSPIKAAVATTAAVAVVAAGTALAAGLTRHHNVPPPITLPAVTGVSPDSGSTTGGTTVSITGTGLAGATRVTFGGVAGRIIAASDTQVTVASPPSTGTAGITVTTAAITADSGTRITGTGTVDIIVTTPTGASRLTAADHYSFAAPRPAVTGVSPDRGSTTGGTTVSITGTGLAGATRVTFGGVAGRITAASDTQVTVTSPPGAGNVTVTVTTPAGMSQTTAVYTYAARPKQTQSISFTAPAAGTAGAPGTLSGTASSGLPVVLSVDPASGTKVCTVSGSTVTYTAAGTCLIDANQAGNTTWAAAPQVQRTITVTLTPQSISFTAPAAGTAGAPGTLSGTASSGLPVVLSVDPASGTKVCTVSGSTVTYTAAGTCLIDANQAGNTTWAAAPQVQRTIAVTMTHPVDQLHRPGRRDRRQPGDPVGHRQLRSPGRALRRPRQRHEGVHRVRQHGDLHRGRHLPHRRQPGRQHHLGRRTPGPAGDRGRQRPQANPDDQLHRPGRRDRRRLGDPVGHRQLRSPGRALRRPRQRHEGVHRVRQHGDLHRGRHLPHRRQPAGNATWAAAPQVQRTITVTLTPQSISFTAPAAGTAGAPGTLSGTASSGLPVVLSVDPASGTKVCTVSGSTVTYTAAGTCLIDANQPGNATWAAAPQVQRTITVTLTPQSITFTAPAAGTAGAPGTLSATASSGLPVVLSVDPASGTKVCTVSGSTVTYTAAGTCLIDANQAGNTTWAAAPQVQRATAVASGHKQTQSISFTQSSGFVGGSPSATASSGLPVVFTADSTTVDPTTHKQACTVSGTGMVTYAAGGSCIIEANQPGNATWAAAPPVKLTITINSPLQ